MALDARTLELIRQKAESGQALSAPTPEKQAYYDQYQNNIKGLVQNKAMSGQQLDRPTEWKNNLYQQYQQEPINKMFGQMQGYIDQLYGQQREAQLAQLRAQRERAIGELNQQKAQVAPQYQSMRNQTDATNLQNVQRLREEMANAGLTASGENVTAQVAQNNQRQANLNSLNLQEQQTMDDFNRRIADLNNPADENALIMALEANKTQALLDAFNRSQDVGYQRLRDTIGDNRYNQEFNYRKEQDAAEKTWREYVFNNMSASEKAQLEWAKKQYGEDMAWRMYELNYQGELNKSLAQSQLNAYTGFNQAQGGGGYSNNYKTQKQSSKSSTFPTFQKHMQQAVQMGVPSSWVPALTELVGRESSWNPSAKNPKSTAHGYGQFLKSTRANYEKKTGLSYSNPVHQLVMMAQYVKDRYGTPEKALAFWDKNRWY